MFIKSIIQRLFIEEKEVVNKDLKDKKVQLYDSRKKLKKKSVTKLKKSEHKAAYDSLLLQIKKRSALVFKLRILIVALWHKILCRKNTLD